MSLFKVEMRKKTDRQTLTTHYINDAAIQNALMDVKPKDEEAEDYSTFTLGRKMELAGIAASHRQAPNHLCGTNEAIAYIEARYSISVTKCKSDVMPRAVIVINNNHGWGRSHNIKKAKRNSGVHRAGMKYNAYSVPVSASVSDMGGISRYPDDGEIIDLGEC